MIFLTFIVALQLVQVFECQNISVTFNSSTDEYIVEDSISYAADSYGHYYSAFNESGWAYLDIHMRVFLSDILSYSS
jgi:hypothetical protein